MIWIGKYKDIYAKDQDPYIPVSRVRGEYRAVLYRSDGSVKQDTGWQPNMVLDSGLLALPSFYISSFAYILLGDSATPAAVGQTTIQGTDLGSVSGPSVAATNYPPTAPNYEQEGTYEWAVPAGTATGAINEFCIGPYSTKAGGNQTIRIVLPATINKGASDFLTVSHKFVHYPFLGTTSGTMNMNTGPSGASESWDWEARLSNLDGFNSGFCHTYRPLSFAQNDSYPSLTTGFNGDDGTGSTDFPVDWTTPTIPNQTGAYGAEAYVTNLSLGGAAGSRYCERKVSWGVDFGNAYVGLFGFGTSWGTWNDQGAPGRSAPIYIKLRRTSDGSVLLKENTHELVMGCRLYSDRYP